MEMMLVLTFEHRLMRRVCVVIALILSTAVARADADARDQAKREKDEGAAALKRGEGAEALRHFLRAYELYPSPKLQFDLALAYDEVGRYADAADALSRFVADAPDAPAEARHWAAQRLAALEQKVGRVQLDLAPADAELRVDGQPRQYQPGRPLRVMPGKHELAVERAGMAGQSLAIEVGGGELRILTIRLEPLPPAPTPEVKAPPVQAVVTAAPPTPPPRPGRKKLVAGVVLAAVGLAVVAGGIACGILSQRAADDLSSLNDSRKTFSSATEQTYLTNRTLEGVFLAVGGASLVSGTVLIGVGARR
jgi:tetratricopeptide (TPR) repeat protein